MKKYSVEIPVAGEIYVTVVVSDDADEDEIWEAAEKQFSEDEKKGVANITWEFHQELVEGNSCNASTTEWSYEEIEGGDE